MNDADRERLGQPPKTPMADPSTDFAPGAGMRLWAWIILAIGSIVVAISWFLPITVHVGPSYAGEDVINAYRAQVQNVLVVSGFGLLLFGAVLYAAGKIVSAIKG